MRDKNINNSLKNQDKNFNKNSTHKNNQIIIDGVDVSKCRYFLKDTEGQDYNTDEFVKGCCEAKGSCIGYEFAGYGLCRGDKDCYFKQLARKTQIINEIEEVIKPYQEPIELDALSLVGAIKSILERKTQECEQIKEKYEALKLENQEGYEIVDELKQECERLKWYLKEIRYDELKALDIEWDEYETHCIDSEYSNIINLVEEALKERNSEDCRYDR